MEKVLGIGGFFFRAREPESRARRYRDHRGIDPVPSTDAARPWQRAAGPTVLAPFAADSACFGDQAKAWMLNFRVRDLEAMAAPLRTAGIPVELSPEADPDGRFGRLPAPEGDPIELWEPAPCD